MRVLLLGASGAMARVALRDLLESVPDVEITAADLRPAGHEDPRVRPVPIDVQDIDATARLMDGHDVAVNAVTYYLNVTVMRAALQARVPYVDLGGLYHESLRQLDLHRDFEEAGVTALLGMGSTPGITNVMAGALAARMERVDEIHVRVACHDAAASGPLAAPYALDTVLDEFTLSPYVFEGGVARAVPPMSGRETLANLPPPVLRSEAMFTLHSEVAMLPRSFPGLCAASFKVGFPEEFVRRMAFLVELGMASREPLVGGVSPRRMLLALMARSAAPAGPPADCDVLRVEVRGSAGGRAVIGTAESVVMPHPKWEVPAGALDTGVPLSIGAQMLARREIRAPGVLCPEVAVPPAAFFQELERRGIRVTTSLA